MAGESWQENAMRTANAFLGAAVFGLMLFGGCKSQVEDGASGDTGGGGTGGTITHQGPLGCGPMGLTCDSAKEYCWYFYIEPASDSELDENWRCQPIPDDCLEHATCDCLTAKQSFVLLCGCQDDGSGLQVCQVGP